MERGVKEDVFIVELTFFFFFKIMEVKSFSVASRASIYSSRLPSCRTV